MFKMKITALALGVALSGSVAPRAIWQVFTPPSAAAPSVTTRTP